MRTWIVYSVRNIVTGEIYVGQTFRSFEVRRSEHLWQASRGRLKRFHSALNHYGADAFEWTILVDDIKSSDEANLQEKYWIITLNAHVTCGGYNLTFGGEGSVGFKHTEASRKKIGDTFRGIPKSKEQRQKMGVAISAARQGKKFGPRNLSEESRQRMSAAQRGKPHKRGWHHSEETRERLRRSHKTYTCSVCGQQGHSKRKHIGEENETASR